MAIFQSPALEKNRVFKQTVNFTHLNVPSAVVWIVSKRSVRP